MANDEPAAPQPDAAPSDKVVPQPQAGRSASSSENQPVRSPAPLWLMLIEAAGALLVAYLFIVVMMTASAQQRVIAILDLRNKTADAAKQIDYSRAWSHLEAARTTQDKHARDELSLDQQERVLDSSQKILNSVKESAADAWDQFSSASTKKKFLSACDVDLPKSSNIADQYEFWSRMSNCEAHGNLPDQLAAELGAAMKGSGDFGTAYHNLQVAADQVEAAAATVSVSSKKITQEESQLAAWDTDSTDFSEVQTLLDHWYLGGSAIVSIPPSMSQIIMSFSAGTFGALLITLVLVVYPQSTLSAGQTKEHVSRIFLGGLIALCVFIVLGGGSAILGNTSAFNQSQANFMTFAAVGVLAGMFSDRVALWLSSRANVFFGSSDHQQPEQKGS